MEAYLRNEKLVKVGVLLTGIVGEARWLAIMARPPLHELGPRCDENSVDIAEIAGKSNVHGNTQQSSSELARGKSDAVVVDERDDGLYRKNLQHK